MFNINNITTEKKCNTNKGAQILANEIANYLLDDSKKYYAIMFFETELNLGISNKPNQWVNIGNRYFNNGVEALSAYANTPNPASQLIDASSKEELITEMSIMLENYNNINWLNENLYPFI